MSEFKVGQTVRFKYGSETTEILAISPHVEMIQIEDGGWVWMDHVVLVADVTVDPLDGQLKFLGLYDLPLT